MNTCKAVKTALVGLTLTTTIPAANAAVALDRTRAIYPSNQASISLNIVNEHKTLPFLAQTWLEDQNHQKITSPLVVLPPLQRLEPAASSVVRVTKTAGADKLPQDRETLFYFNLQEIPPKSSKSNTMQLAFHTQIKLFYRPEAIIAPKGEIWQEKMVFTKNANGFSVENPTPFYITLTGMARNTEKQGGGTLPGFDSVMFAPKSTTPLKVNSSNISSFVITYVNDYGGHPELRFMCNGNVCNAVPDEKND